MFRKFACCNNPFIRCGILRNKCGIPQCKCTRERLNIKEITYVELLEKAKEGTILIDVRTRQEFLEGHLKGAILIPYYDIRRKIAAVVPNKDAAIIVYCKNGGRSSTAYEILQGLGYTNIYNLKGGIEEI